MKLKSQVSQVKFRCSISNKCCLKSLKLNQLLKGDTATGATKNAIIETGFQIKVPLFISEGEVVIVNTVDGKYQGRA